MITLTLSQKVLLHIDPKDVNGNSVSPFTIEQLQFVADNPGVVAVQAMEPDRTACWAHANSPGMTLLRVRGQLGQAPPDETIEVTVLGPATSFNLTADAPVSQ